MTHTAQSSEPGTGSGTGQVQARTGTGRRFISALFCDVVGSTELAAGLEPERWAAILDGYFAATTEAVERAGGRVEKFIGDAVVAVFGLADGDEHAARDSAGSAAAILLAVDQYAATLRGSAKGRFGVRVAIASGYVAFSPRSSTFVIGAVLNRAARLQQAAAPGAAVVDLATWLQTRAERPFLRLPDVTAKGFEQPLPVWQLEIGATAGDPVDPSTRDEPDLVDRVEPLRDLTAAIDHALANVNTAPITMHGPAGLGKTRLLDHVLRSYQDRCASVVVPCPHGGERLGVLPLYGLLDQLEHAANEPAAGAAANSRGPRLQIGLSLAAPASIAESAPAQDTSELRTDLLRALRRFRGDRPLIFVVDNAQWLPPALAEFVRSLTDPSGRTGLDRTAVLLVSRTPTAPAPVPAPLSQVIELPPLPAAYSLELAEQLTGSAVELHDLALLDAPAGPTPAELAARSGGNPLYLEQLVQLIRYGSHGADQIPPSAHAVIGARLDLLGEPAQDLVALLAAHGEGVTPQEAAILVPDPARLAAAVTELHAAQLLDPRRPGLLALPAPLSYDVAYERLTLAEAGQAHTRLADCFAEYLGQRPAGVEVLARHREAAYLALRDTDRSAESVDALATAALTALQGAARLALSRGTLDLALSICDRARVITTDLDRSDAELCVIEAYAYGRSGRPALAAQCADRVLDPAANASPEALAHARLHRLFTAAFLTETPPTGPAHSTDSTSSSIPAEPLATPSPETRTGELLYQGIVFMRAGAYTEAARDLAEGAALAADIPYCLGATELLANAALALANGDTPAPTALSQCQSLYAQSTGSRLLSAAVGLPQAMLLHMCADYTTAATFLDTTERTLDELGHSPGVANLAGMRANLAVREGDWPAAHDWWQRGADRYVQLGLDRQSALDRLSAGIAATVLDLHTDAAPAPADLATIAARPVSWGERTILNQAYAAAALVEQDLVGAKAHLEQSLTDLAAVRGSGVVIVPLVRTRALLRTAALLHSESDHADRADWADLTSRVESAVRTAIRTKQDIGCQA